MMRLAANGTIGSEGGVNGAGAEVVGAAAETEQQEEEEVLGAGAVGREIKGQRAIALDFKIPVQTISSKESLPLRLTEASHMAKSGDNMYFAWWEDNEALFAKSTDNGATFGDVINLSNSPYAIDYDSRVVTSGKNVYVTWSEDNLISSMSDSIWFKASSDYGTSFGPPIRINNDAPLHDSRDSTSEFGIVKPTDDHSTHVAASGNNVYVVWYCHEIKDNWEVYFRASNDGGRTFGETIDLSNSPGSVSHIPEITTDAAGNVYVTYWDEKVGGDKKQFAIISTDEGRTFSSPIQLIDSGSGGGSNAIIPATAVSASLG
jgi:hypothetical protein